jgi:DNA-binding response OmpR family regulator
MDLEQLEVKKSGKIIYLSKLEFELLKYLAQNKGIPLSREDIYKKVW